MVDGVDCELLILLPIALQIAVPNCPGDELDPLAVDEALEVGLSLFIKGNNDIRISWRAFCRYCAEDLVLPLLPPFT